MKLPQYGVEDVTIAVLNYNGLDKLQNLFNSIFSLNYPPKEVIMVDDGSTDGSPEYIRKKFPAVKVIEMDHNTKQLNRVRNVALENSGKELVLIVDNDVSLKLDCLDELLKGLNNLPDAAVCMPRTLYDYDHNLIYQDEMLVELF